MIIAELFENPPQQWGLRGDPCLWEEMRLHTANKPIPATEEEFGELLQLLFYELTGGKVEPGKKLYVVRFALKSTGMSSGHVDCNFWIDKGFPFLLTRYRTAKPE